MQNDNNATNRKINYIFSRIALSRDEPSRGAVILWLHWPANDRKPTDEIPGPNYTRDGEGRGYEPHDDEPDAPDDDNEDETAFTSRSACWE